MLLESIPIYVLLFPRVVSILICCVYASYRADVGAEAGFFVAMRGTQQPRTRTLAAFVIADSPQPTRDTGHNYPHLGLVLAETTIFDQRACGYIVYISESSTRLLNHSFITSPQLHSFSWSPTWLPHTTQRHMAYTPTTVSTSQPT
jgi:hypothetical protein